MHYDAIQPTFLKYVIASVSLPSLPALPVCCTSFSVAFGAGPDLGVEWWSGHLSRLVTIM